ncbi:MAG: methyltransferase, partial [Deltaproteobacteria bacterium]|nr:methyltransferase [Deltaproteobacteria bacterium]
EKWNKEHAEKNRAAPPTDDKIKSDIIVDSEGVNAGEEPMSDVIKNPGISENEAIAEKIKLKRQVVDGVKTGKFKGAVRFGTVDELQATIKTGRLPVSEEYGEIHAQPIMGRDDDAFAAYGAYDKHNMAMVFPEKHVMQKSDAKTKEVVINPDVPLEEITFLVDGHKKAYRFNELVDAIKGEKTKVGKSEELKSYTEYIKTLSDDQKQLKNLIIENPESPKARMGRIQIALKKSEKKAKVIPEKENREDVKVKKAVAKLRATAARVKERAKEKFNQERNENTSRRARMAQDARGDAAKEIANAETMIKIADAIAAGEVEALAGVKNKTHVEALESVLNRAKYKSLSADHDSNGGYEKNKGRPPELKDLPYAEYPGFGLDPSMANSLRNELMTIRGGEKLSSLVGNHNSYETAKKVVDFLKKKNANIPWQLDNGLKEVNRFRQMGINDVSQHKKALTALIELRSEKKKEDPIKALERGLIGLKIPSFFPTPKPVIDRMLDGANIEPGMDVLEPSAGKGDIADALKESGVIPDVLEVSATLTDILKAKKHEVVGSDFLEHTKEYDRIVMNPPFEKGQDVDHVKHAYALLKPGGRVVSIMGEHPFFASDKKSVEFREWLDDKGYAEKLPEGSFKNKQAIRQTGVASRIVIINKPGGMAMFSKGTPGQTPMNPQALEEGIVGGASPEEILAIAEQEKAEQNRKSAAKASSFRMWVKYAGGIQMKDKTWAGEIRDIKGKAGMKGMPPGIFKKTALGIDEMTLSAIDAGWLPEGSTENDFMAALENNPHERVLDAGSAEWVDNQVEIEYAKQKQLERKAGESEDDITSAEEDGEAEGEAEGIQQANEEAAKRKNSRDSTDEDGFDWGSGAFVKEQLGLFGKPKKKPFALTPDEFTETEKLARAQDKAKKKGVTPKGKKPTFQTDKAIKTKNVGKQQELFGPDAGQKDLFTNDKGQIELDFKPTKKAGPIRKQQIGMADTGGQVKAAGWMVGDMDTAVSLLSEFKDHAQENLFLITTNKSGKVLEIHRYSKGEATRSLASPTESIAHSLNIPEASKVYFIHNHPGADRSPS